MDSTFQLPKFLCHHYHQMAVWWKNWQVMQLLPPIFFYFIFVIMCSKKTIYFLLISVLCRYYPQTSFIAVHFLTPAQIGWWRKIISEVYCILLARLADDFLTQVGVPWLALNPETRPRKKLFGLIWQLRWTFWKIGGTVFMSIHGI